MTMERIILTTGGTGGHIFPALAVAEEIRRRNPHAMILFMGGQYGQEADLAAKAGIDFVGLPVKGVIGRGGKGIFAAIGMARGVMKALAVIRKVKPDMVVGFGGYAAFAGVLAGRMAGKNTAIHEQNSFPGLTNRLLGKIVNRVFLSMPDTAGAFAAHKTRLVGNPVRANIAELYELKQAAKATEDAAAAMNGDAHSPAQSTVSCYGGVDAASPFDVARNGDDPNHARRLVPTCPDSQAETGADLSTEGHNFAGNGSTRRHSRLLVMGGSLGARSINQGILAIIGPLLEAGIEIWHQTGQADYEQIRVAYREAKAEHVRVEPFIADMQRAYAWADLALCRAGGSSMAELTAAGLPAVLVPYPFAAQDHQRHNARFLEGEGGAVVLEQDRFYGKGGNPAELMETLTALLNDSQRLRLMAARSLAAAKPYAARDLVDGLEELAAG